MSHIAQYQCSLKGINEEFLKKAFQLVAKKYDGEISETIRSAFHGSQKVLIALTTPETSAGIGVKIEKDGQLSFLTESDHRRGAVNKIIQEIEKTYKVLAISAALSKMGYHIQASQTNGGTFLEGEKE